MSVSDWDMPWELHGGGDLPGKLPPAFLSTVSVPQMQTPPVPAAVLKHPNGPDADAFHGLWDSVHSWAKKADQTGSPQDVAKAELAAEKVAHWLKTAAENATRLHYWNTHQDELKAEDEAYNRLVGTERARERRAAELVEADDRLMTAVVPTLLSDVAEDGGSYRVEALIVSSAVTLLWAQAKTGKTTLLINYLKSLTTGSPFLGCYAVQPLANGRRVGVLNFEMNPGQFRAWADAHGVDGSRVAVWSLRGMPNPLASPTARERLLAEIKAADVEVLLVDTYARAALSPDENDSSAATAFFKMLSSLASAAGVSDVVITHHAGWAGDRLRGASALQDYPDVLLGLTRDEQGRRYLQATGRFNGADEGLEKTALEFDPASRTLTLTGTTAKAAQASDKAEASATKVLADHMQLITRAEALVQVLTTTPVSQAKAFELLEQAGQKVHRAQRPEVVAYAVDKLGVVVGGLSHGPTGQPRGLARGPLASVVQMVQAGSSGGP